MHILNTKGLSAEQLHSQLLMGDRLVVFDYCYSVILFTSRCSSDMYLIKQGESAFSKGIVYSLISFFAGWWGFPWGPIRTIQSFFTNFGGGRDITHEVRDSLEQTFETDASYRQAKVGPDIESIVRLSKWSKWLGLSSVLLGFSCVPGVFVGHLAVHKLKYVPELEEKRMAIVGFVISLVVLLIYLAMIGTALVGEIQKTREKQQRNNDHISSEYVSPQAESLP